MPELIKTTPGRRRRRYVVPLVAGVLGATVFGATRAGADTPIASATLRDVNGHVVGRVRFYDDHDHTVVKATLTANANVKAGQFHGFHVHVGADAASGTSGCVADPAKPSATWFVSAGGHLKADGQVHSHHNGDLQSLLVNDDGSASTVFTTDRVTPADLAGRAVILHAGADNFGNVPVGAAADQYTANSPAAVTKTENTGNAGDRVACGTIRVGGGGDRDR
jgi:Cu-Zn family superoxide dismutase